MGRGGRKIKSRDTTAEVKSYSNMVVNHSFIFFGVAVVRMSCGHSGNSTKKNCLVAESPKSCHNILYGDLGDQDLYRF